MEKGERFGAAVTSIAKRYGTAVARREGMALLALFWLLVVGSLSRARAARVKVLAFGDSLISGYGLPMGQGFVDQLTDALRRKGYDVCIINGGAAGDTSADGQERLDWALTQTQPQAVILEFGGNDALRGLDPSDTEKALSAIIHTFTARKIPVLLCGMYAPPNMGEAYSRAFRAVFDKLGHQPGVLYYPFFLAGVAGHRELLQADGIHPNPDGVRLIVKQILPYVERLLAEVRSS